MEKFFDTVKHDLLIKKFLKSGVMVDGLVRWNEQGTPQGGNLSPLLSNIYLTSDYSLKRGVIRLSGMRMTATSTSRAGEPPKE